MKSVRSRAPAHLSGLAYAALVAIAALAGSLIFAGYALMRPPIF
jgi:hypothetical protein